MTEDKSGEDRTVRLRRLAEERSRESAAETARTMAEQDYQVLVHELQVHQIELEMQNEELRMAQGQLGESLAKYGVTSYSTIVLTAKFRPFVYEIQILK